MNKNKEIIEFAKKQLGKPYIWGSNGMDSFDCSGLVIAALRSVSLFPDNCDVTAQDIYYYLLKQKWDSVLDPGSIVFYGRFKSKITHTGIYIGNGNIISASGGDHLCTTVDDAKKRNAKVKITDVNYRSDLVAFLNKERDYNGK